MAFPHNSIPVEEEAQAIFLALVLVHAVQESSSLATIVRAIRLAVEEWEISNLAARQIMPSRTKSISVPHMTKECTWSSNSLFHVKYATYLIIIQLSRQTFYWPRRRC